MSLKSLGICAVENGQTLALLDVSHNFSPCMHLSTYPYRIHYPLVLHSSGVLDPIKLLASLRDLQRETAASKQVYWMFVCAMPCINTHGMDLF